MASITIRNLDDDVKERLRVRAASNGRSMEAELRLIVEASVAPRKRAKNIALAFMELAEEFGGFELELPSREDPYERPVPFSDEWEQERADYMAELAARRNRGEAT